MKRLLLILLLLFICVPSFPQDTASETSIPFTWTKTVTLQPGETADLTALSNAGFKDAWAEIIGRLSVNGVETLYTSWCANSTVKVVAVTEVTIVLKGN